MWRKKAPFGLAIAALAGKASATTLIYEPFDYASVGTELSTADGTAGTGWLKVPSASTLEPTIRSGSLSYAGSPPFPASTGNSVSMTGGATAVQASSTRQIPGQPYLSAAEPTLYYSMLFNVSNTAGTLGGTGSFVTGFRNNTSTNGLASFEAGAPLMIRTGSTTGTYQLGTGLTQENADRVFDDQNNYSANQTLLLVLAYQFVNAGEDFARLYVNPDPTKTEAENQGAGGTVGNALKVIATATDGHGIRNGVITNFFLRNNGSAPDNFEVDELRIATSWEDAFTTAVPGVWLGGAGNWSDSAMWSASVVPNVASIPVKIDNGNATASVVALNQDASVRDVQLDSGDTFNIQATRTLTLSSTSTTFGGVVNSAGTITAPALTVSGVAAEVHLNPAAQLNVAALTISSGGKIFANAGANLVIKVNSLTINNTSSGSKLDLADNKLIAANGNVGTFGTTNTYSGLTGLIASGRNGGGWTGGGIVTSQTDATTGSFTSIGIATAAQVKSIGASDTAVWAGQTVTGSDALVMYTYGGDANLDGKLNVDDYGHIDSSIPVALTGWFNGDFNYDGKINVDDYGIIDFNIGIQGASFPTGAGAGSLSAAVPEPVCILPIAGIALTQFARRRRRAP